MFHIYIYVSLLISVVSLLLLTYYFVKGDFVARRKLTDEQLKECLDRKGTICPCCGEDDESKHEYLKDPQFDGDNRLVREIECQTCYQTWREVYTLTAIERNT